MSANAKLRVTLFEARDALAWSAGGNLPELARLRATSLVEVIDKLLSEPPTPEEIALAEARSDLVAAEVRSSVAFQRGAEAMREAAAKDCIDFWGAGHASGMMQAGRIRALPIPEDK